MEKARCINQNLRWKKRDVLINRDGKSYMYKSKFEMEKARYIDQQRWKKRDVLIKI